LDSNPGLPPGVCAVAGGSAHPGGSPVLTPPFPTPDSAAFGGRWPATGAAARRQQFDDI